MRDLPALVAELRDAGLPVEYQEPGERGRIPPGVDLAVYRIVQEALTNVLRHAGRVPVRVVVTHRGDAVELSVVDEGPVPHPGRGAGRGGGHGLIGMRERVALYGERLTAGPRPGGGYAVAARVPTGEVR